MSYLPDSFESEEQRKVWIDRGYSALNISLSLVKKYEAILDDERKDAQRIGEDIEKMKLLPIKPVVKLSDPPGGFN